MMYEKLFDSLTYSSMQQARVIAANWSPSSAVCRQLQAKFEQKKSSFQNLKMNPELDGKPM